MASTSFSMTFFGKGYSSAAAAAGKVTTCGMPCSSSVWQTRSRDISALLCLTGLICWLVDGVAHCWHAGVCIPRGGAMVPQGPYDLEVVTRVDGQEPGYVATPILVAEAAMTRE